MTESEIERRVERMTNHLDNQLIAGSMSQKNYDIAIRELSAWANLAHAKRTKNQLTKLWESGQ